ncbi:MAG: hypothetical protein Q8P67_11605 [archaeon]|nr:hypothetical protein [archaeon]
MLSCLRHPERWDPPPAAVVEQLVAVLVHPNIASADTIQVMPERVDVKPWLAVVRLKHARSLKDVIRDCGPLEGGAQKAYGAPGARVSAKKLAGCGAEILKGLVFLKSLGLSYPYLHPGNVLLSADGACLLSDFENAFVGLPPHYPLVTKCSPEVEAFANTVYELATGCAPPRPDLLEFRPVEMPSCIPSELAPLLSKILNPASEERTTLSEVVAHPFFKASAPKTPEGISVVSHDALPLKVRAYLKKIRSETAQLVADCREHEGQRQLSDFQNEQRKEDQLDRARRITLARAEYASKRSLPEQSRHISPQRMRAISPPPSGSSSSSSSSSSSFDAASRSARTLSPRKTPAEGPQRTLSPPPSKPTTAAQPGVRPVSIAAVPSSGGPPPPQPPPPAPVVAALPPPQASRGALLDSIRKANPSKLKRVKTPK